MCVISFLRTALTCPGNVPYNDTWNITVPDNIPKELENEFINLVIERKDQLINQNKNIISDNLIETNYSYSISYLLSS